MRVDRRGHGEEPGAGRGSDDQSVVVGAAEAGVERIMLSVRNRELTRRLDPHADTRLAERSR